MQRADYLVNYIDHAKDRYYFSKHVIANIYIPPHQVELLHMTQSFCTCGGSGCVCTLLYSCLGHAN
jgi:hypothetical protein